MYICIKIEINKSTLKKYYEKQILPKEIKDEKVYYVFNFCDLAKNYYIEATSCVE